MSGAINHALRKAESLYGEMREYLDQEVTPDDDVLANWVDRLEGVIEELEDA